MRRLSISSTALYRITKIMFGWVVAGNLMNPKRLIKILCNPAHDALHEQIFKFWEIEETPSNTVLLIDEQRCENHFTENTHRDKIPGST